MTKTGDQKKLTYTKLSLMRANNPHKPNALGLCNTQILSNCIAN